MALYGTPGLWRRRVSLSVVIAGSSPVDCNITIPPELDAFWSVIDSSGNNLRLVSYDGRTVLTYAVDNGSGGSFDKANKLGRLRIDGMVVPTTAGVLQTWMYFDPSSNQSSGASAVTITSPVDGFIEVGRPGQHRVVHQSNVPRSTKPRKTIHKTATEQAFIWIRYDPALGRRSTPGNGSSIHEEALMAYVNVQNSGGSDQTGMYDTAQLRWVFIQQSGELWLRVRVKAGSSGTNYTLVAFTHTVLPGETTAQQKLETRVGIAVSDSLES